MKRHLLQQTIILTLLTGVIGMTGGCSFSNNNQEVICDPAVEGSCVVSYNEPDKYLAQDFAAYETAYLPTASANAQLAPGTQPEIPLVTIDNGLVIPETGTNGATQLVAVSGPGETPGVSVQEKQVKQELAKIQERVNTAATNAAQKMAEAEAAALNQVMNQVVAAPVYFDPATGQYTTVPTATSGTEPVLLQPAQNAQNQIVTTDQSFATQQGTVMGGNDLEDQIVATTETDATNKQAEQTEEKANSKKQAPVEEVVEEEPFEMPLEQRVLFGEDVQDWDAPAGESLRSLLLQWGEQSGWTVIWKLDRDYTLEAGVVFRGTFMEAASAFIRSFARATPAPIGTFYKGNRVLVINTQEGDNVH